MTIVVLVSCEVVTGGRGGDSEAVFAWWLEHCTDHSQQAVSISSLCLVWKNRQPGVQILTVTSTTLEDLEAEAGP